MASTSSVVMSFFLAWLATTIDIEFAAEMRTVPWPTGQPQGVALFDGPLCYGLAGDVANVNLSWALLADGSGRPCLESEGRPQVTEPSGGITSALEPISARWLEPDIKNPIPRRVPFQRRLAK